MAELFRIACYNAISPRGLARLSPGRFLVGPALAEADAILLRSHPLSLAQVGPRVKAVGRAGAGVNNIPVAALSARGVPVFNAPGANANAVRELVLAAMLMGARNIAPALDYVRGLAAGGDYEARVEEGKRRFAGFELPGRTLGVIGLGAIGGLVADTAIKLGMHVLGYDPEITVDSAWRLPAAVRRAQSVEEVLKAADVVTLHVPLVEKTRGLLDARRLALAKPGALLLNFARDAIVDEAAVLQALEAGSLAGYLCDFPTARIAGHPRVVALPHLGASTEEAEDNSAAMVVDAVRDFLEEGTVRNAVNFPAVEMARESAHRMAIANANVPNMLGQISTTMAQAGLNIHNMVNKSRGEMAYTLVDLDSAPDPSLIERLALIPGVLAVRALPAPQDRSEP